MSYNGGMPRGKSVKKVDPSQHDLDVDFVQRYYRRIIYLEIIESHPSSMRDAIIHFFYLKDGKMLEYEVCYSDSAEFYCNVIGLIDRYTFADMFRSYRFRTNDYSCRVLIHKGVILGANNDLGGFVFQNNQNSFLISPYEREVFERLNNSLLNYTDGVAQLVRVRRLLMNEKFRKIHDEFFGKIGVASLNDGETIKMRYADSIANNNVITDAVLFDEYLDMVNAIPMSDFTDQNVVTQLAKSSCDTKQILIDNYSNFLFADDSEIEFAAMILDLFLHRKKNRLSLGDWAHCVNYIRYLNGDAYLRDSEAEYGYEKDLLLYRANYVLKNVQLPKLVHFIYDFFDFGNLSRNIGTFYLRLNELVGEDIRSKYTHLETINVSLKSLQESQNLAEFFLEPKLVNFSTAADKEIKKQLLSGEYDRVFAAYYLCNYMQVADYKKYSDVLPAVFSILKNLQIKNEDDFELFWMAGELLNEFWKLIPEEDAELQGEIEKLVYATYWQRVGDVWPVIHRNEVSFTDEWRALTFRECLGWLMCLKNEKLLNKELRGYLSVKGGDDLDIADPVDRKRYCMSFSKQKDHSLDQFIGNNGDDESWYRVAIYCDDISDGDIFARLINAERPLTRNKHVQKMALEQLLLKVRNDKDAKALFSAWLEHFDEYIEFLQRFAGNHVKAKRAALDMLVAVCESITSVAELDYISELSQMLCKRYSDESFSESVRHALEIADARLRKTKFQRRDITPEYVRSLS